MTQKIIIPPGYVSRRYYPKNSSCISGKGNRQSFGIYMRYTYSDGSSRNPTYNCNALEVINKQFRSSVIDFETAKKNVHTLVRKLNREIGVLHDINVFSSDNEKILADYWEKKYRTREIVDKRGAHNSISLAVRALGNVSLLTATQDELQNQLNEHLKGNKQRKVVNRINSLLQHIGRDIELAKFKPVYDSVKYQTWDEFARTCEEIRHKELRLLAEVCFFTGMRQAEGLAGKENIYRIDQEAPQVFVHKQVRGARKQMDGSMSKKSLSVPKSKKRWAYIFEEGIPVIRKWLEVYKEFDLAPSYASKLLKDASMRAFPNNPEKWIAFNGLRHSYAKSLYEMGLPTSHVAKHLGNTERVCEQFYVGWEHTPASMLLTHTLVQKNKHKLKA